MQDERDGPEPTARRAARPFFLGTRSATEPIQRVRRRSALGRKVDVHTQAEHLRVSDRQRTSRELSSLRLANKSCRPGISLGVEGGRTIVMRIGPQPRSTLFPYTTIFLEPILMNV